MVVVVVVGGERGGKFFFVARWANVYLCWHSQKVSNNVGWRGQKLKHRNVTSKERASEVQ